MNFVSVFDQLASIAQIVRKCPTPVLQDAYVTAYRDWCSQTRWLRTTIAGATAIGDKIYSLGSDPLLEVVSVGAVSVTANGQTMPLMASDPMAWGANVGNGLPRQYAYIPEGQIALHPTPNAIYQTIVSAVVQPVDGAASVPDDPLRKYRSAIEAGALEYLLALPGTPWSNPGAAAGQGRVFRSGISNAKAEVQRGFNTGAQRVTPRAFLSRS